MAKLSAFTATKTEVDVPFGEPDPTTGKQATFKVAYSGNDAYRDKLATLMRARAKQTPGRELPPRTVALLQRQAMIGTVLLGWDGLYEEKPDGSEDLEKPLKFTPETAAKVLGTPILYGIIDGAASDLSQFQESEEAASKEAVKSGNDLEPPLQ